MSIVMGRTSSQLIDFSQNLNPFGPPSSVWTGSFDIAEAFTLYGEPYSSSLKKAVSGHFEIDLKSVGIGIGATQILFSLPRLMHYSRAVIPMPTFWEYEVFNARAGIQIERVSASPEKDFTLDFDLLATKIGKGSAVYLSNVCNPTSKFIKKDQLLPFIESHPETQFVIDETYLLFREDFSSESLIQNAVSLSNLFIVFSLSKIFTLPGIRVGVLIAHPDHIEDYESRVTFPYAASPITEQVACAALADREFVNRTRTFMTTERMRVSQKYKDVLSDHIRIIEPEGNFILAQLLGLIPDVDVVHELETRYGLSVRMGSALPGLDKSWIRFSLRQESENDQLLLALKNVFEKKH